MLEYSGSEEDVQNVYDVAEQTICWNTVVLKKMFKMFMT
jgi:hypothetical protein